MQQTNKMATRANAHPSGNVYDCLVDDDDLMVNSNEDIEKVDGEKENQARVEILHETVPMCFSRLVSCLARLLRLCSIGTRLATASWMLCQTVLHQTTRDDTDTLSHTRVKMHPALRLRAVIPCDVDARWSEEARRHEQTADSTRKVSCWLASRIDSFLHHTLPIWPMDFG